MPSWQATGSNAEAMRTYFVATKARVATSKKATEQKEAAAKSKAKGKKTF